jgi:hypothetical protein
MMAVSTVVAFTETSARARVCTCGPMVRGTKVNSWMDSMKGWERTNLRMAVCMLESGAKDSIMGPERVPGRMAEFIKVNGTWAKLMGMERRRIRTEVFVTMDTGRMMRQ